MKTLHIVDVSNWMYRAYYACAPLTAPDGTPTGAIRTFVDMVSALLAKARDDEGGAHIVFACDPPSGVLTWRHRAVLQWIDEQPRKQVKEIFATKEGRERKPTYKGNRNKEGTEDLRPQLKMIPDILRMAGFCVICKPPYEADDIGGTLAKRFAPVAHVKLYSRDKDYTQLVTHPNIELIMPKQANSPERIITYDNVHEFFGTPVEHITDVLALSGDKVDNIPGLPGVGDGTAIKLINEHKTIDKLIKAAPTLKSKAAWARALRGEVPYMDLHLMKELVTIDLNVPKLPRKMSEMRVGPSDDNGLKALKKRLKFKSIFHI